MHIGFGRLDGEPVHHFQAGRQHAAADDGAHRRAALGDVVEGGEDDLAALGFGQQFHGDFEDDGEHALGAGQKRGKVVARHVQGALADHEFLALDGERAAPARCAR